MYSVCGEAMKMTSLDCSPDVILLFVLMNYPYFVPLDYTDVVGNIEGNPHEKFRGVPKGGVIKGV